MPRVGPFFEALGAEEQVVPGWNCGARWRRAGRQERKGYEAAMGSHGFLAEWGPQIGGRRDFSIPVAPRARGVAGRNSGVRMDCALGGRLGRELTSRGS